MFCDAYADMGREMLEGLKAEEVMSYEASQGEARAALLLSSVSVDLGVRCFLRRVSKMREAVGV